MRWIYILKCEDDYYYVGVTKRLFRRFWEHNGGSGGVNTSTFKPEEIVAIYKVDTICKFLDYNKYVNDIIDNIIDVKYNGLILKKFNDEDEEYQYENSYAENNIAECLMVHDIENWNKIRGGKYTRFDIDYKYPDNAYIKNLPLCKCGLPCDVRKNEENNYLYFRCAKKNMWESFRDKFNIDDDPCNFFMEYTKDKQLKIEEKNIFQKRRDVLKELFKKSDWLKNIELNDKKYLYCIGGCNRTSEGIKLSYSNKKRNLCFDCFIEKNEELKNKYDTVNDVECLFISE